MSLLLCEALLFQDLLLPLSLRCLILVTFHLPLLGLEVSSKSCYPFVSLLNRVLLPWELPLKLSDPFVELVKLHEYGVVVLLDLLVQLKQGLIFFILLSLLPPPVPLTLAELFYRLVSLLSNPINLPMQIFYVIVELIYQLIFLSLLLLKWL